MEIEIIKDLILVAFFAGELFLMYRAIGWADRWLQRKERECERDRNDAPECMRTCLNAREKCSEREEECYRYEPRRVRKHYDPRTGEVG